jgi:hypothetical protein
MFKYEFIILLVTLFGGGAGIYYGVENQQPLLTGTGFICAGIGLCLNGIGDIIRREVTEFKDDYGSSITYSGGSAILLGFFWCIGGVAAISSGIAALLNMQTELLDWVKTRPGALMIPAGLAAASLGGHFLLGAREERSGFLPILGSLPKRIFGLVLLLGGLGLSAAGILEMIAPAVYINLLAR